MLWISTIMLTPPLALAVRPRLTLATSARPPLTAAAGQEGFLEALARDVFGRIAVDAQIVWLPGERPLINANAGIEDGDMLRAPGFEHDYPNLVQVPVKVLDFEFVAYALGRDVQVRDWSDLERYSVAYARGWKIYERKAARARAITTVRDIDQLFPLLAARRTDVVLLDRWQGLWLARQAGLAMRPLEPPLARAELFIYLHRRHLDLVAPVADALTAARHDGTWQRLYDRILRPLEASR